LGTSKKKLGQFRAVHAENKPMNFDMHEDVTSFHSHRNEIPWFEAGLPDGLFSNQFWYFSEGLGLKILV
jgi:hypothetical protein